MATIAPWTPEHDTTLAALHAQDLSVRQIAERMGMSKTRIASRAAKAGLGWDRTRTRAATHAAVADAKARRAILELNLLADAERLRAQMWTPVEYIDHGGKDYIEVRWHQDEPTPTDKLKLMQAATAAIDRSIKIAQLDADGGATEATSMLQRLADAMGVPAHVTTTPALEAGA